MFSEDILDLGAAVLVVDATSTDHAVGVPELTGNTLTQPIDDLDDGAYQVRWRVVSGDGHPIAGSIDFVVGDPASAEPITAGTTAPTADAAVPDATTDGSTGDTTAQAEPATDFWASVPTWQYALFGAVAGFAIFTLLLRLRRAR